MHVIICSKSNKILSKAGLFIICGPQANIEGPYDTIITTTKDQNRKVPVFLSFPAIPCALWYWCMLCELDAHYQPSNLKFEGFRDVLWTGN